MCSVATTFACLVNLLLVSQCMLGREGRCPSTQRCMLHMTKHLLLSFALVGLTANATLAASVNASLTPRLRIAEHSATRQHHTASTGLTVKLTKIPQSPDPLGSFQALLILDQRLAFSLVLFMFFSQITLQRAKHDLHPRAVLVDFGKPLGRDVFEGAAVVDLCTVCQRPWRPLRFVLRSIM